MKAQNTALQPASERAAVKIAERAQSMAAKGAACADARSAAAQHHYAKLIGRLREEEARVAAMRSELRAAKRAAEAAAAPEILREQAARPLLVDEAVARALQACEVRAACVDASAAAAAAGAAADARAQLQRLQASKASARAAGSAKGLAEDDARSSKIWARNAEGQVRSLEWSMQCREAAAAAVAGALRGRAGSV